MLLPVSGGCLLGSVPSLAAGLVFGGLAGFGAYQISGDPKNVWVSLGKLPPSHWPLLHPAEEFITEPSGYG